MTGFFLRLHDQPGHVAAYAVRHKDWSGLRRKAIDSSAVKIGFGNIYAQHLAFRIVGLLCIYKVFIRAEGNRFAVGVHRLFGEVVRIKDDAIFLSVSKCFGKCFFFFFFFFCPVFEECLPFPLQDPHVLIQLVHFPPLFPGQGRFALVWHFGSGDPFAFFQEFVDDGFGFGGMVDPDRLIRTGDCRIRCACRCRV